MGATGPAGTVTPLSVNAQNCASSLALPFSSGVRETSYAVTLTGNCTLTPGTGAAGQDQLMTIDLIQDSSGGHALSIAGVSWAGGVAPTFNTATTKRDTIQIRTANGDTSAYPVAMGRLPTVQAAPGAPATPTATPGNGQATITVAAVTAYPAVSGYTIRRGTASGAEAATPIAVNVSLPYADTGLTNGVTVFYVVAAVNSVGTGSYSGEASSTPSAGALPGAPSAPTVSAGNAQNVVTVAAVTASPPVSGYTVYRGTAAGGESATPIATNVPLPYTDAGLINGTAYYYKVAAVNSAGTGPQSPEATGTPTAPNATHYATFNGNLNGAIYTPPQSAFNPGSSVFDMRAHISMAAYVPGGTYEQNLIGAWDGATPANRLWRLGITTAGAIRASWASSATAYPTAVSSAAIPTAGNVDVWVRAVVTPTSGSVTFYTSSDGSTWTQLGTAQTASSTGAVYAPGTAPYVVIGQNASASGAAQAEEFTGRMIEAQLLIGGTLITDPVMGPSSTTDSKGFTYGTSSTGVTYQ